MTFCHSHSYLLLLVMLLILRDVSLNYTSSYFTEMPSPSLPILTTKDGDLHDTIAICNYLGSKLGELASNN